MNRKNSTQGNKINWGYFQNIIFDRNSPFILKFKEYDQNEAPIIEISLKKKGITVQKLTKVKLPFLYPHGRAIQKKKYDDLIQQMDYVPQQYHDFFMSLKYVEKD